MSVLLSPDQLDIDAVRIIEALQRDGYTAYLVGGCVRDALLGSNPKDFDIATTALPDEVKETFGRRCRLIGRRFKLAHVRSGPKLYEVATFRGPPEDQDADDDSGFVVRANVFGSPEEDAHSRDFTVNGLFYDPISHEFHDYVGGMEDVKRGVLRTIGDAEKRLREDPVRLLRAIKFAGRLGLVLDEAIVNSSRKAAPWVHECPVARVTEEQLRMMETGHARETLSVTRDLGVVGDIIPEMNTFLEQEPGRWDDYLDWLGHVDHMVRAHGVLPRESTFTLLAWPFVKANLPPVDEPHGSDWGIIALETITPAAARMALPMRQRQCLRATANVVGRLLRSHRRGKGRRVLRSPALPLALSILRLEYLRTGEHAEIYERWAQEAASLGISAAPIRPRIEETLLWDGTEPSSQGTDDGRKRRRRRRRRGGDKSKGDKPASS